MPNPFPIPKTFECPYCGEKACGGEFDTGRNVSHFSHRIKEKKKVGRETCVTLHTIHQFVIAWENEKWQVVDRSFGSSKMCEKVELPNGDCTDWCPLEEQ